MSDDLAGAGITAKERLERIELALGKIDTKLDTKVDRADLVALEARVRDMELHGTAAFIAWSTNEPAWRDEVRQNISHIEDNQFSISKGIKTLMIGVVTASVVIDAIVRFFSK